MNGASPILTAPSTGPALALPFLARRTRAWQGITVEWERVAPFELEPQGYPLHRLSLVLNRCQAFTRRQGNRVERIALEASDVAVAPAEEVVGYGWDSPLEVLNLLIDPLFLEEIAARTMEWKGKRVELISRVKVRDPFISAVGQTLLRELEHEGAGSRLLVDSLSQALAIHLLRVHARFPVRPFESKGGLPRWRLQRVQDFIEANLSRDLSLTELAGEAGGLSRYHFARQFKQSTGCSPYQYVIRRRVLHAQTLLRGQPQVSLAEVAFSCGFADQSAFSRAFRQVTGLTPNTFRNG